ncbi:MAG: metallophosphoesterase [Bacteroidales bacterium]|nr:metallophosphoesterase [Bacteroidales bacterium]
MYDIIGDIHGYHETLLSLLKKLGYKKINEHYQHTERKAIFVGDLVDRGPKIRETLQTVKAMVENNAAFAVMGNHEYNAICFNTLSNGRDSFLRPHSRRNINQHQATLDAFASYPEEWQNYLLWLKDLPLFIELEGLRVVHACWDASIITYFSNKLKGAVMDDDFLFRSAVPGSAEYKAVETLLKGYEVYLPPGFYYRDRDGNSRTKIRVKWWKSFENETYRSISLSNDTALPDSPIPHSKLHRFTSYAQHEKPVFFGHYWNTGKPELLKPNVCCVDYSLAKCEKLVAYRWNGEKELDNKYFIWQECVD